MRRVTAKLCIFIFVSSTLCSKSSCLGQLVEITPVLKVGELEKETNPREIHPHFNISEKVNNVQDISYSNKTKKLEKKIKRRGRGFRRETFVPNNELTKTKVGQKEDVNLLRRNLLYQLGQVDPLLCLPKAICGISSQRHKKSGNELDSQILLDKDFILNYLGIMRSVVPKNDVDLKEEEGKRKSKKRDERDSSEEEVSNESIPSDDLNYYKEKARIEKWIREDEFDPEPNWWDLVPSEKPYYEIPVKSSSSEADNSWGIMTTPSRISKSLSSFFGSMLPSMSWGIGKAPDVFADDPFFADFRKRSLDGGQQRSLDWLFGNNYVDLEAKPISRKRINNKLHPHSVRPRESKMKRNGNKGTKNKDRRGQDGRDEEMKMIDDPVEKFKLAAEIGKELEDPKQCDYIFTGCPFTHLEIIEIIETARKSSTPQEFDGDNHLSLNDTKADDQLEISVQNSDNNDDNNKESPNIIGIMKMKDPPSPVLVTPTVPSDLELGTTNLPSFSFSPFRTDLLDKHKTLEKEKKKKRRKHQKPKRTNTRKQWGWESGTSAPTRVIPIWKPPPQMKYKPQLLPTTINKINYHFHNTNSHPQVVNSHHYPTTAAPTNIRYQLPPASTPLPPTSTSSMASVVTPKLKKYRRRSHKKFSRRRNRKKLATTHHHHRNSHRKGEERIVIRLPKPTPTSNHFNLFPLPNSFYSTPHPQMSHSGHGQNFPMYQHPPPPHFYSQESFGPHGPHGPHPFYPQNPPPLPPGLFPFYLGKK